MKNHPFKQRLATSEIKNVLIVILWIFLVGAGFWKLVHYSNTPGASAQAQSDWPEKSLLSRDSDKPTLVIFAHAQCPCSAATLGELERLMSRLQGKSSGVVLFYKPRGKTEDWVTHASLWKKAQRIPGLRTIIDEDGTEAARFGAFTSWQTFLYDLAGKLVFRGGITPERGHMGDNDGRAAILNFFSTGKAMPDGTRVFGCSLKNPERALAGI